MTLDRLSGQAKKWIESNLPGCSIRSINRLRGSTSSILHEIKTENTAVVLRQFNNEQWLREEPNLVHHEAASLQKSSNCGLPAPSVLAFDNTGEESGIPSVLMTKIEGEVILRPDDFNVWTDGLAKMLAEVHKIEAVNFPWAYFTYTDIESLGLRKWSSVPEKWEEAFQLVQGQRPESRECFIHRDYHPANVLWQDGRVSGIVDWPSACRGPAGIDVGHCRLNLALLHGVDVADLFLDAYVKHAGSTFKYEPYWDILSAIDGLEASPSVYPGWAAFGVTGLTDRMIEERLDAYMESLIYRVAF